MLAARFGISHVATGDLLRSAVVSKDDVGLKARAFMDAGELVPDEIVLELLRRSLSRDDTSRAFVLDGFPRNTEQGDALERILTHRGAALDAAVFLDVPNEEIVQRLSQRVSCSTCGRAYSLKESRDAGRLRCSGDGGNLVRRADDDPAVIRRRLEVFREQTSALVRSYDRRGLLRVVTGTGVIREVFDRIVRALGGVISQTPRDRASTVG
jgi:adenylate kinase